MSLFMVLSSARIVSIGEEFMPFLKHCSTYISNQLADLFSAVMSFFRKDMKSSPAPGRLRCESTRTSLNFLYKKQKVRTTEMV